MAPTRMLPLALKTAINKPSGGKDRINPRAVLTQNDLTNMSGEMLSSLLLSKDRLTLLEFSFNSIIFLRNFGNIIISIIKRKNVYYHNLRI